MGTDGPGDLLNLLRRSETANEQWRNSPTGTRALLGHAISERLDQTVLDAGKPHVPTNRGVELVLMVLNEMLHSSNPEVSSRARRALGI